MEYIVFVLNGKCFQFDQYDVMSIDRFRDDPDSRELSNHEIETIFGEDVKYVGPHNTSIDEGGNIVFDKTKINKNKSKKKGIDSELSQIEKRLPMSILDHLVKSGQISLKQEHEQAVSRRDSLKRERDSLED